MILSDAKISKLKPGAWLREEAPKGTGRLVARATAAGRIIFYFRYTRSTGGRDSLPLGAYDPKGEKGLTLREARAKSGELSRLYQSGTKDIRVYVYGHRNAPIEPEEPVSPRSGTKTLRDLLNGYVDLLFQNKKITARQVRNDLQRYVIARYPDLCDRVASSLVVEDIRPILNEMIGRGITRMTESVRAYLHAAYGAAMRAESDASAPSTLRGFGIKRNPVSEILPMTQFNNVGEHTLSELDLGHYLIEVRAVPSRITRSALLLALLLGGQRMEQLLRLRPSEIDIDDTRVLDSEGRDRRVRCITLRDPKGRRKKPRNHVLPIFGETEEIVNALLERNRNEVFVISNDGKTALSSSTASHEVHDISVRLHSTKAITSQFRMADIRRTCETQLAKLKIHKDIRAHIQSHGLGGVQDRHYDRYEYLEEKFQALEKWASALATFEAKARAVGQARQAGLAGTTL